MRSRYEVRVREDNLRRYILRSNMSLGAFAAHCGIEKSHLCQLLQGKRHPSGVIRSRLLQATQGNAQTSLGFDDLFEIVEKNPTEKEVEN